MYLIFTYLIENNKHTIKLILRIARSVTNSVKFLGASIRVDFFKKQKIYRKWYKTGLWPLIWNKFFIWGLIWYEPSLVNEGIETHNFSDENMPIYETLLIFVAQRFRISWIFDLHLYPLIFFKLILVSWKKAPVFLFEFHPLRYSKE